MVYERTLALKALCELASARHCAPEAYDFLLNHRTAGLSTFVRCRRPPLRFARRRTRLLQGATRLLDAFRPRSRGPKAWQLPESFAQLSPLSLDT